MYRALIAAAGCAVLLAGCSTVYEHERYADARPYHMTRVGQEIDYELLDAVLFDTDSATVSPRARAAIADIALEARRNPQAGIIVDGFTDRVGAPDHNLELSRMRAISVADLLTREGIPASRIQTHGYGETRLAVPTADQVAERRNRRVVIRILPPAQS